VVVLDWVWRYGVYGKCISLAGLRKYTGPGLETLSNKRGSKKRRRSFFAPLVLFPSLIIDFYYPNIVLIVS
jgi:hypothetical protein